MGHFLYASDTNKSTCQILVNVSDSESSGNFCGHSVTGKYPTNLMQYLRRSHPKEYKEVERKESEQVMRGKGNKKMLKPHHMYGQQTLTEPLQRKYDKESEKCKLLGRKLAHFIGGTNVANSIVDNTIFRSLLEAFDPRYTYW